MSKTKNNKKGKLGEELAAEYILKNGFRIIEQNWRYSRLGEIDIIAEDNKTLVFIEVKARSTTNFGHPAEAVNRTKLDKIRTLASIYLNENENLNFKKFRFDVIAVLLGSTPQITYLKDVYQF